MKYGIKSSLLSIENEITIKGVSHKSSMSWLGYALLIVGTVVACKAVEAHVNSLFDEVIGDLVVPVVPKD